MPIVLVGTSRATRASTDMYLTWRGEKEGFQLRCTCTSTYLHTYTQKEINRCTKMPVHHTHDTWDHQMYRVILMYVQEHVSCVRNGLCVCIQMLVFVHSSRTSTPTALHTHRRESEMHMHTHTPTPLTHTHTHHSHTHTHKHHSHTHTTLPPTHTHTHAHVHTQLHTSA